MNGRGSSARETVVHALDCAAPESVLYELVADASRWPTIMPPFIHVRYLDRSDTDERWQAWGRIGDRVQTWVSRRHLDPERGRITFEQESTDAPFAYMGGQWDFEERDGGSHVVLQHRFTVNGDEAERARVVAAVDNNSMRDLAALCQLATLGHPIDDLVFSFTDELRLPVSADEAYSFVNRSDLWPELLPHVSRVDLTEPRAGVQFMEMDTVTSDGQAHTTQSIRLCFPPGNIVYKQLVPPSLLLGHSGAWDFGEDEAGTVVAGRHSVAINPKAVHNVLGPGCTLADARDYLREALGANSRATLSRAGGLVPAQSQGGR